MYTLRYVVSVSVFSMYNNSTEGKECNSSAPQKSRLQCISVVGIKYSRFAKAQIYIFIHSFQIWITLILLHWQLLQRVFT